MGFFGRGVFAGSLVYLNEIGRERFRGWSMIVIFAVWGLSSLLSSAEWVLKWPPWIWYYGFIFTPVFVGFYLLKGSWKPSPAFLYENSKNGMT